MRLKKILVVSLLLLMTFIAIRLKIRALPGSCGCSLTYMGAILVSFYCESVGGEMTYRECHYSY